MSRTIHKYQLPVEDTVVIQMPEGARPLSVHEQRGTLCLWAEVEPDRDNAEFVFQIRGTGHPLDGSEGVYIGTVVMSYGLVWHVYSTALQAHI